MQVNMIERTDANRMVEDDMRETYFAAKVGGCPVFGIQYLDNETGWITVYLEAEAYTSKLTPRIRAAQSAVETRMRIHNWRLTSFTPSLKIDSGNRYILSYPIAKRDDGVIAEVPLYKHDCEHCTFLGRYDYTNPEYTNAPGPVDLYHCTQGMFLPTVIARYSDEGHDYQSGMPPAGRYGKCDRNDRFYPLAIAYRRAVALGLPIEREDLTDNV